jgi:hypothetical protein
VLEGRCRSAFQPEPEVFREAFDIVAAAFLGLFGWGENGPFIEFDLAVG